MDSSASHRLQHEARVSSSLAHPNICTIREVGETNGELYIVMELVEPLLTNPINSRIVGNSEVIVVIRHCIIS
jgi:serine/threonine protein kinase